MVSNNKIIPINQNQFLQSIIDWTKTRLCPDDDEENCEILKDISVLDPAKVNTGVIHHGKVEDRRICRHFRINEMLAIQGLRDVNESSQVIPEIFKPLLRLNQQYHVPWLSTNVASSWWTI